MRPGAPLHAAGDRVVDRSARRCPRLPLLLSPWVCSHARHVLTVDAMCAVTPATGALERPLPVPGWTHSRRDHGGRRAGPAQDRGHVPQASRAGLLRTLAGSSRRSPRVRATLEALLDMIPRGRLGVCCRTAPAFMASPYFVWAANWCARSAAAAIHRVRGSAPLLGAAAGDRGPVRRRPGGAFIAVERVLLRSGVVPDVNLAAAAVCALAWSDREACFVPVSTRGRPRTRPLCRGRRGGSRRAAAEARDRLTALALPPRWDESQRRGCERAELRFRRDLARGIRVRAFLDALGSVCACFRVPVGDTLGAVARKFRRQRPQLVCGGMRRAEPDEGTHALRDGAVPGPILRVGR